MFTHTFPQIGNKMKWDVGGTRYEVRSRNLEVRSSTLYFNLAEGDTS